MILYTHIDLYVYTHIYRQDICSVSTHFNSVGAPQRLQPVGLQCRKDLGLQSQRVLVVEHLGSSGFESFQFSVASVFPLI